jgi:hypothetical protein
MASESGCIETKSEQVHTTAHRHTPRSASQRGGVGAIHPITRNSFDPISPRAVRPTNLRQRMMTRAMGRAVHATPVHRHESCRRWKNTLANEENTARAWGSPVKERAPRNLGGWGTKRGRQKAKLTMSALSFPQLTQIHSKIFLTFVMKPGEDLRSCICELR